MIHKFVVQFELQSELLLRSPKAEGNWPLLLLAFTADGFDFRGGLEGEVGK